MKLILMFGPPGAGKGTQGEMLQKNNLVTHLSTGNVLRENISKNTVTGLKAKSFMDQGKLVPDEVLNEMIGDFFSKYKSDRPLLLDGYPRTVQQGKFLVEYLKKTKEKEKFLVINIQADEQELINRMKGRGRSDDTEDTIKVRLRTYDSETKPLISFFLDCKRQNLCDVANIDGMREVSNVYNDIQSCVSP